MSSSRRAPASPSARGSFLESTLAGKDLVGGRRPFMPVSRDGSNESWPESTRDTVRSSLPTGEGTGDSSTPILPFDVRPVCARCSFEGG
jgi:hypothetical protein